MTAVPSTGSPDATWLRTVVSDPLVAPMLRQLGDEYSARYGKDAHAEMARYPGAEFEPPDGVLLLLLERGEPVAGGAYRRYDARTAELKRIWTHAAQRRRGLARRVVAELERTAASSGYRRVYLTTGPRQPEARALYLAAGYSPLFDLTADPETIGPLPFTKDLATLVTERPSAGGCEAGPAGKEVPTIAATAPVGRADEPVRAKDFRTT